MAHRHGRSAGSRVSSAGATVRRCREQFLAPRPDALTVGKQLAEVLEHDHAVAEQAPACSGWAEITCAASRSAASADGQQGVCTQMWRATVSIWVSIMSVCPVIAFGGDRGPVCTAILGCPVPPPHWGRKY